MRRLIASVVVVLVLALAGAGGLLYHGYTRFLRTPLHLAKPQLVRLKQGMSMRAFGHKLAAEGVLAGSMDARYLDWYSRISGKANHLKAGEYQLTPGMKPPALVSLLVSGHVYEYRVTIVEGWTFQQMMNAVEHAPGIKHTLIHDTPAQVMKAIGHASEHAEGRFFPDTYYYPRGTTDVQFLKRAYLKMQRLLGREWKAKASGLPYSSPYQALILASIVEKETAKAGERARVAGVFVRRLERGMRLEADPTVIYALGSAYNGDITVKDLRDDSPYNTYRHSGLPPTPICLPGKASIHAALHPDAGKALYFVSTGKGYHVFSDTLAQHDRQVRKYQLHGH